MRFVCIRLLIALSLTLTASLGVAGVISLDEPMGEATARAVLNRFGFGPTPASLVLTARQTPRQYLDLAIHGETKLPSGISSEIASLPTSERIEAIWDRLGPGGSERFGQKRDDTQKALQKQERQLAASAIQARMLAMVNSDNQGHGALLTFWLNHFSIYAPKSFDKILALNYALSIERAMQADSFEELLRASFFHPAMQVYLDNAQSTATNSVFAREAGNRGKQLGINENLARELLELHTLGVNGGYSQRDIQELARIITGVGVYSPRMSARSLSRAGAIHKGLFLFDPRRHDYAGKHFLGHQFVAGQGLSEVDLAIHLMATHPETGRHLAYKLAQRFLDDEPPPQLVAVMAERYSESHGKISAMLQPLLASPDFADSLSKAAKFKEPMDYVLSMARAACGDQPVANRLFIAATSLDMGQAPFMHTTPDGYGARESDWQSPAAMAKRVRLAIATGSERVPFAEGVGRNVGAGRMAILAEDAKGGLMKGTPCSIDRSALAKLVGPISPTTQQLATTLSESEQAGLLLASPEFMRH